MRGDLASSLNQTEMIHLYRRSRVGWCIIPKRAICKDPGRVPSPKSHFHAVVCAASLQVPSAIMQRAEAILGGQFGSRANLCLRRSEKWISQQVSRQIADDAGGGHQTALHRAAPTRFAPLAQRWLGRCSVLLPGWCSISVLLAGMSQNIILAQALTLPSVQRLNEFKAALEGGCSEI